MSRFLEAIFVLGCSLVGFGLSATRGDVVQNAVRYSVQLVRSTHAPGCYSPRRTSIGLRASKP